MYPAAMHSTELLKGTLQTIVLKVLSDHGKMYGYELTQRVKELSGGTIVLTEGALYPYPAQNGSGGIFENGNRSCRQTHPKVLRPDEHLEKHRKGEDP